MSYTYLDLQQEVKNRTILNQSGTEYDSEIKFALNTSLFRLGKEGLWKQLRRQTVFNTEAAYTTGTGACAVTNGQSTVTVTGATFVTNNIKVGRWCNIGNSKTLYQIGTITGETTFTLANNQTYDGTTTTTGAYKIFGTEEYTLPLQIGRIGFIWHMQYGFPYVLYFTTDKEFYETSLNVNAEDVPTCYRMWGENNVIRQPNSGSVMRVASSSSADTSKNITIFGTVSGYPDYEIISTNGSNGTTAVSGTKTFTAVERISKDSSTTGRITVDCNSATVTVGVLPVGDTTGNVMLKKIQLWPLCTSAFPIYVQYYKDVWRMVNDGDMHELGGEFDEAIILLATAKVNYGQSKSEGDKFFALYQDEVKKLKRYNIDRNLDWKPDLKRAKDGRKAGPMVNRNLTYTQIGGMYGPRAF